MLIGEPVRKLREEKKLSQGDIEHCTGMLRAYISRLEHGHVSPTIETLEKLARALEVPLYRLFYDGTMPMSVPQMLARKSPEETEWGRSGADAEFLSKLRRQLAKLDEKNRMIILHLARKLVSRGSTPSRRGG
jgi:transcriptional regulator with XRE-family HTH domain